MQPFIFSFLTFISTTLGGLLAIKNREKLHYIMSFTAGVLIAVCFFDILPEAFSLIQQHHFSSTPLFVSLVVGFFLFHLLEKTIALHHSHESEYAEHKHPSIGLFGASGLSFHSFLDGVGIGLGFHVNAQVGVLVSIAVIAHDFSDGLNTVTLMLTNRNTINKSVMLLLIDAIMPVLGVITTYLFQIPENILLLYLGFFAGFLLYIGASDLLPEAHSQHSSWKMIGLTLLGVIFIFLVTRFT